MALEVKTMRTRSRNIAEASPERIVPEDPRVRRDVELALREFPSGYYRPGSDPQVEDDAFFIDTKHHIQIALDHAGYSFVEEVDGRRFKFGQERNTMREAIDDAKRAGLGKRGIARNQPKHDKRPFIVNIYDRDMQREMDIETFAVSPRKAVANGWFRLMKIEDFTGAVGVFKARYGERYRITARDDAGAAQEREGIGESVRRVDENYKPSTESMTLILESLPNPDFGQSRPLSPPMKVKIKSMEEGRRVCQQYIVQYRLGGGNWRGKAGRVVDSSGGYLGRFSYNGRWWPATEEED